MPTPEENMKLLAEQMAKAVANIKEPVAKPSHEEQLKMFKAVAADTSARTAYTSSRADVILPLVREQSTVRSIFKQEVLEPTAQSSYPVNFDYTEVAAYLPKMGSTMARIVEGDEIFIPTFQIEAGIRYPIEVAEEGRLDLEAQQTLVLKDKIVSKEEIAGWGAVKGILSGFGSFPGVYGKQTVYCSGNSVDGVGTPTKFGYFSKDALNRMLIQMDKQRRVMSDIYVSPQSHGDIRSWTTTMIDFLTQREIFQAGGLPGDQVWNVAIHKVYNSRLVDDNYVYGFDTRTFGKMPIRMELRTYEDPTAIMDWKIGVMAREKVGFGVTDSYAVVQAVLNGTGYVGSC